MENSSRVDDRMEYERNWEIEGFEIAFPEESHDTGFGNQGEYNESPYNNLLVSP